MARGLLDRILDHAFEEGWVKEGSVVCDPFFGIGSTAILGAYKNLRVIGCELEPPFVKLARGNIELHRRKWEILGCAQPVILQGDSRELCRILSEADIVISSPPFQGSLTDNPSEGVRKMHGGNMGRCSLGDGYGSSPGQLGNMRAGSIKEILLCKDVSTVENESRTIEKDVGLVSCKATMPNGSLCNEAKQNAEQSVQLCTERKITTGRAVAFGGADQNGNDNDLSPCKEMGISVSAAEVRNNTCESIIKRNLDPDRNGTIPSTTLKPYAIRATLNNTNSEDFKNAKSNVESVGVPLLPGQEMPICVLLSADEQDGERKRNFPSLSAMKPGSVEMVLSSPPYAETLKGDGTQSETAKESRDKRRTEGGSLGQSQRTQGYGSAGNLGNLKPGDISLILSSPPYEGSFSGGIPKNAETTRLEMRRRGCSESSIRKVSAHTGGLGYGKSEGQLGNLKPGDVEAIISSPPFMITGTGIPRDVTYDNLKPGNERGEKSQYSNESPTNPTIGGDRTSQEAKIKQQERAANVVNLGNIVSVGNRELVNTDTFWAAAKTILEQCYAILKPGGVAIWVVKSFVHKSKIVDFPGDWRKLCEAVGFKTRHEHHAMLFKEEKFTALWGEEMIDRTNRNSFFRTLANNKAGWRTYWEIVPEDERLQWLALAKEQLPPGKRPHIVLTKAQELCFKDTAERIENWNDDVRIDYETVLCCQKQGD